MKPTKHNQKTIKKHEIYPAHTHGTNTSKSTDTALQPSWDEKNIENHRHNTPPQLGREKHRNHPNNNPPQLGREQIENHRNNNPPQLG